MVLIVPLDTANEECYSYIFIFYLCYQVYTGIMLNLLKTCKVMLPNSNTHSQGQRVRCTVISLSFAVMKQLTPRSELNVCSFILMVSLCTAHLWVMWSLTLSFDFRTECSGTESIYFILQSGSWCSNTPQRWTVLHRQIIYPLVIVLDAMWKQPRGLSSSTRLSGILRKLSETLSKINEVKRIAKRNSVIIGI